MGLLDEAKEPGDGVDVARLNRSMYGFRDASNNWMRDWQNLLESEGDAVGKANLVLSFNNQRNLLADRNALLAHWQSIGKVLASRCKVRESHRLGFGEHRTRTATDLNRVVVLGEERRTHCCADGARRETRRTDLEVARIVEIINHSSDAGNQTHGRRKREAQLAPYLQQ